MFMLNLVGHLILISFLMKLSPFKMMSAIKSGVVSHSRFAKMAERDFKVSSLSLSFVSSFFVNPTAKRHFKSKTILLYYHLCCRHSVSVKLKANSPKGRNGSNILPSVETKTSRISG